MTTAEFLDRRTAGEAGEFRHFAHRNAATALNACRRERQPVGRKWADLLGLQMLRVVEPETVRKVCLYRASARTLSPAAHGFAEFLAGWLAQWHAKRQAGTRASARRRAGQ